MIGTFYKELRKANKLIRDGQLPQAFELLRRVTVTDAGVAQAWDRMGHVMQLERFWVEGAICWARAVALEPTCERYAELAKCLLRSNRVSEAEKAARAALLAPGDPDQILGAKYDLAYILQHTGRSNVALQLMEEIRAGKPNYPDPKWILAHCLLALGHWKDGFAAFEARRGLRNIIWDGKVPEWKGQRVEGKTINVVPEQGFGDNLQFWRFVKSLREASGATIRVLVPPPLGRLATQNLRGPGVLVEPFQEGVRPKADYWIPLCSIPHVIGVGEVTGEAYLEPMPMNDIHLTPGISKFVGIVWRGSPDHELDRLRSSDLHSFMAGLARPGIELYSLQVGGEQPLLPQVSGVGLVLEPMYFPDFAATSGLIAKLDCVVTVDSAVAHLTGALGVPGHVLIPYGGLDYRWMAEGSRSPWYDSLHLWRQREGEPWRDVLMRVGDFLEAM